MSEECETPSRFPPSIFQKGNGTAGRDILTRSDYLDAGVAQIRQRTSLPWIRRGRLALMTEVTRILEKIEAGDVQQSAELLPLVYDELRRLAARELRNDPAGNTLQPTALVHEAYVRLVDQSSQPHWNHRGHFYAAAAQSMRRILVESARRKQSKKRGGRRERVPLKEDRMVAPQRDPELLALDEALARLASRRPKAASLVSLRYFAGLTMEQAAASLGVSLRTAERHWTYAKAWLLEEMSNSDG